MGKLVLSLDTLYVQSFQTGAAAAIEGREVDAATVAFSPTVGSTYCSCPNLCKPHD